MLYERLAAQARTGDGLDDVRLGAVEKVRWLVDLLDRQRRNFSEGLACRTVERYEEIIVAAGPIQTQIRERLSACREDERRAAAVVLTLAADFTDTLWDYHRELALVVPGTRGWAAAEVAVVLAQSGERDMSFWLAQSLAFALTAAETLDVDDCRLIEPWLQQAHRRLMNYDGWGAGQRSALAKRIRRLLTLVDEAQIPAGVVPEYDCWAKPLRDRVGESPTRELAGLIVHLAAPSGPRPASRWRRRCRELVEAAHAAEVIVGCLRGLAEGDASWTGAAFHYQYLVHDNHLDLARGLAWAAALTEGAKAVPDLVALALRTGGPGGDVVEQLKLAGAAINALGDIDDPSALEALWQLQRTIRHRALRKQLDVALAAAAGRQAITPGQLVERSVPAHGLAVGGMVTRELGDNWAGVVVEDASIVRLAFTLPDGRQVRSVPTAVKERYADQVKELRALAREVRGTLSAERSRIEQLMAGERGWTYEEWGRHYRDHPITGAITRSLIWEFASPEGVWAAALPAEAGLLTADERALPPPGPRTPVRLWHPIRATTEEILAWREFVTGRWLRQPFKQAFREIYLLTPAELETVTYSNRFAAHIVRYPQLYALFKTRGWQANFLGRHDGGYQGEARGTFAEGEWRARFYHDSADEDFDYRPDYAATDQVRFERRAGRAWHQAPLAEVPAAVFSEAMRDVDLFVGVTSIAADPGWTDRGEDRYADYWWSASFGELTAGAEMRRDALARILPRMKIADRCTVTGRYLTVRGDLRTYKIHLGSANILMEPDDSYLCIVPDRRPGGGTVFLPFEDERLSLILSKAFLLAADMKITDQSIIQQIKRGA